MTVAQLEHALAARVRVEQSIGVLAERHRLQPRQAFDLLRQAARSRGQKVVEIAETVVGSASNPLLPLPEELARQQRPPAGAALRPGRCGPSRMSASQARVLRHGIAGGPCCRELGRHVKAMPAS